MKSSSSETIPACLKPTRAGVLLFVKVQPRASRNEIGELLGHELKIKIAAPPVDAAANDALLKFLAETLGCARGAIRLIRGGTSRHKILEVRGVPWADLAAKLA